MVAGAANPAADVSPPTARTLWPAARARVTSTPPQAAPPESRRQLAATTPGRRLLPDEELGGEREEGPRKVQKRAPAPEAPARETMNVDQLTNFMANIQADLALEKQYSEHIGQSLNHNAVLLENVMAGQNMMLTVLQAIVMMTRPYKVLIRCRQLRRSLSWPQAQKATRRRRRKRR